MNKEELKALVARILEERGMGSEPPVKGAEYRPTEPVRGAKEDLSKIDLRKQYLVSSPQKPEAFLALKEKTPARLGMGRAGSRYLTSTMLRFRGDHAAAQDSVFSLVPEDFPKQHDLIPLTTLCKDKEEFITRPDLGRRFDEPQQKLLRELCGKAQVLLVIGDGLSSKAITANAIDCAAAIRQGLEGRGISVGKGLFVKYCRVGASDHIGSVTDCEAVCMLIGERPGLITDESMSAYLTYRPRVGIAEAKRTVISNIHAQGIGPVEAGAHIASVLEQMLRQKASGIDLRQEAGT